MILISGNLIKKDFSGIFRLKDIIYITPVIVKNSVPFTGKETLGNHHWGGNKSKVYI